MSLGQFIRLLASAALWVFLAAPAIAQDSLGVFKTDPARFFAANSSRIWVGRGRFMMIQFSDTVAVTADTAHRALMVRRVLVNEDDTVVVSRGYGSIGIAPGDTAMPFRWAESRYPEVTGRMKFIDGQWGLEFDGEWKQWSIRLSRINDNSFNAQIGRALGSLPPVMFSGMTYQALPVKSKPKSK